MRRSFTWLSCFLIASLVVTLCHGEQGTGTNRIAISGQAVDEQSRGVAGVRIRGVAHTDITESTTDKDGKFVLNVLEERVRQLSIIADDTQSDRQGTYKAQWSDPPGAETTIRIPRRPFPADPPASERVNLDSMILGTAT